LLTAVFPPDHLVFVANLLESDGPMVQRASATTTPTTAVADDDLRQPLKGRRKSVAERVHACLVAALAKCLCTNNAYLVDVVTVLCRAAAVVCRQQGVEPAAGALPALDHGATASPAVAPFGMAKLHACFDGAVSASDHGSDLLSFVVHTCRRQATYQWLGLPGCGGQLGSGTTTANPPALVRSSMSQERRQRLVDVLTRYAAECQFKRTNDRYLHLVVRMTVPPWAASKLAPETNPFPVSSRAMGHHANDVIRPLIDLDVALEMRALASAAQSDPGAHTAQNFILAAVLIEELCGGGPSIVLNGDIGMLYAPSRPRLCVLTDMGCTLDNTWGYVTPPQGLVQGDDVYDTLICWLDEPNFAPAGKVGKGLRDLATAVRGETTVGGNMVSKYIVEKSDAAGAAAAAE